MHAFLLKAFFCTIKHYVGLSLTIIYASKWEFGKIWEFEIIKEF